MAGESGIEPLTDRLTADCTTAVLLANVVPPRGFEPRPFAYKATALPLELWRRISGNKKPGAVAGLLGSLSKLPKAKL